MICADYHVHTSFSGDCDASMEDMVQAAKACGLTRICFTDHMDYDYPKKYGADFEFSVPLYFQKINEIKEESKNQIEVLAGIELGVMPHLSGRLNQLVNENHFDFIIASSHVIKNEDPYFPGFWEGKTEEEGYLAYFNTIIQNIRSFKGFDTYGHIDYIVRYGIHKNKNYTYQKYAECLDEIMIQLIEAEKALEINTAGYKYGLNQAHPQMDVLKRYRELGGELITIGADAHNPAHIAYNFKRAEDMLLSLGFRYYTVFKNRKPEFWKLGD